MAKTICWTQHTKRIETEKNGGKNGKALQKLTNKAVYGKAIKNLKNRINVKLVSSNKMNIKTKLRVAKNIWIWFSWGT